MPMAVSKSNRELGSQSRHVHSAGMVHSSDADDGREQGRQDVMCISAWLRLSCGVQTVTSCSALGGESGKGDGQTADGSMACGSTRAPLLAKSREAMRDQMMAGSGLFLSGWTRLAPKATNGKRFQGSASASLYVACLPSSRRKLSAKDLDFG